MGLSAFLSTQVIDTTSVGRSVMTAADAAAARLALELGTLATQSGTFSGTSSGTNTGDQTITLTGDVTGSGTGSFATTIANSAVTNAMLAGSIAISKLAITGTPDGTKFLRDDGTWAAASGGSGITSLNGLTGATQTFAVGTSGTDFAISSSGTSHTFNIPDASASARGLVTTGAQTWAGAKTFNSQVAVPAGGVTQPGVKVGSGQSGMYIDGGGYVGIALNGNWCASFGYGGVSHGIACSSANGIGWKTAEAVSPDLVLWRDAANTLAQRNSTNAQTFNLANTYTSSTNFEYGRFQWNTNQFRIGTAVGSAGGTQRSTVLGTWNAAGTWSPILTLNTNGSGTWTTQSQEVTFSGSSQLYIRTGSQAELCGSYLLSFVDSNATASHGQVKLELGGAAAVFSFLDTSSTAVDRVVAFGGRTSSFPALKRSGTTLQVRLADDSAAASMSAGAGSFSGAISSSFAGTALSLSSTSGAIDIASRILIDVNQVSMRSNAVLGWSNSTTGVSTIDVRLARDAAGTLSLVNSTNAQTFNLANTYTSSTNFEYGRFQWASNQFRIGSAIGSAGGSSRQTVFGRWDSAGAWTSLLTLPAAGSSAITMTGGSATFTVDTASQVVLQGSFNLAMDSSSFVASHGRGRLMLAGTNATFSFLNTSFAEVDGNVNFGGTTASYVGLRRSGTTLQVVLADNSAAAPLSALTGTFASGTITSSTPGITLTQTWNSGATTFTGLLVNVTNTASASASLLMDLQVGGVSQMAVSRSGSIDLPNDGWIGESSGSRVYFPNINNLVLITGNAGHLKCRSNVVGIAQSMPFVWGDNTDWTYSNGAITYDLALWRDAANTLAQRNSTNAQTFNLANTYTSSTNFEYGRLQWASNEFRIGTAVGSAGGTQRNLVLGSWNTAGAWNPTFTMTPSGVITINTVGSGNATLTIDNSGVFGNGRIVMGAGGPHGQTIIFDPRGTSNWSTVTTNSSGIRLSTGGTFDFSTVVALTPLAATSGSQTGFTFTAPAPTGQTASTEATMVNWNLASTVTFAAGALTTQRAFRIQAPTYAFASASTITTASTLSISGAPTAGTNATITNAYALNVESGSSNFQRIFVTDGTNSFESSSWAGAGFVVRNSGNVQVGLGPGGIRLTAGAQISFCSDAAINTPEIALIRDAANTLAQRNSTNAQTFRVYNTFTSTTSHEYLKFAWATNVAEIGTVKGSAGGSARDLVIKTDDTTRMTFGSAGTATVNTAFVTSTTALINSGSQAFSSAFHVVSWNGGCFGWASTGTVTAASTLDTALKRVSAGLVEINTGTAGVYGSLVLKDLRMSTPTVPATSTSTGSEGQISWDSNYIYVCTATNTWKRAALATW